ncbi:MAG: HAD family hydrolase [Spirochaetaceae bacterium]|jgi:putative hydrolase of the HAD superfamily|nr:HAD family hydrolase [Spirochaetaceae bacterium]
MDDSACLISLIRDSLRPMLPLPPPPLPPALEALVYRPGKSGRNPFAGVRGVLFDVYGTLFSSAAGDIETGNNAGTGDRGSPPENSTNRETPDTPFPGIGEAIVLGELKAYFRSAVREIREKLTARTAWPEVRAEEIWAAFIRERGLAVNPRELALRYELAVNPVYPMPGALEILKTLRAAGLSLGIISNAQFYTPFLFAAFFGALPEALGFEPRLLFYSYELREAKPSPRLFAKALDQLTALGIRSGDCLYVGNDMLNDIHPAAALGFQTLLFAGDGRSLRLRQGNPLVQDLRPTGVIRSLADLKALWDR